MRKATLEFQRITVIRGGRSLHKVDYSDEMQYIKPSAYVFCVIKWGMLQHACLTVAESKIEN